MQVRFITNWRTCKKIGNKLGEKLFGDSASSSRKEDVKKIINTLNKVVIPSVISSLSDEQQKENFLKANDGTISSLVGNFTPSGIWGKKIIEPISLAQIFYDNSSYTKVGLISGGIQINDSKLTDKSFLDEIKVRLQTEAKLSRSHIIR